MDFRLVSDSGIWFLRAEHDGRVHVAPLVFLTDVVRFGRPKIPA